MTKSFKELKEISQGLADRVGIEYKEAARVVASFSAVGEWDSVDAIRDGDTEIIKEGFKRAGVLLPDMDGSRVKSSNGATGSGSGVNTSNSSVMTSNKPEKPKSNKTITKPKKALKKPIKADQYRTQKDIIKPSTDQITPQAVEIIEKYNNLDYVRGELPAGLADDIKQFLKLWAEDNNIEDLSKCASLQWRAACIYVGWWIKDKGILLDREAMTRSVGGSRVYDGEKVAALLDIFQALSTIYRHIPLHTDFIAFSGISREWFFDYNGAGVTSSNTQIIKKAIEIENGAISSGVTDSRENPTGRIFYAKARLGWREADQVQPIQGNDRTTAAAIPIFDINTGRLISEKP